MRVHREMLLKDLAGAGESARRALDRAGLDYCCDGERTLAAACARAGIDPGAIETQLGDVDVGPASERTHQGITALLDEILELAHPRTKRALAELVAAAASVPSGQALRGALDQLVLHAERQMIEEEQVLFARVRALADARKGRGPFPPAFRTIHEHGARLREGHARTHEHLRRLRALIAALHGRSADRLRARFDEAASALTEQMHLENNELLPRALDLEPNGGLRPHA